MAPGSNFDPDSFINNPMFTALDARMSQILRKCGSTPKNDIIEELLLDFDTKELEECKDIVFGFAMSKVNNEYTANGGTIPEGVKIELRKRRVQANHALDMVDLVLYVGGIVTAFPKDVLSSKSTYVEIISTKPDDKEQGSSSGPCQQVIKNGTSASDKCCCVDVKEEMGKHATLLLKLKDFVLKGNVTENDLNSAFKVIDFRGSNLHQTVNGQNSKSAASSAPDHSAANNNNDGSSETIQPAPQPDTQANPQVPAQPASQPASQPDTQTPPQVPTQPAAQPDTQTPPQVPAQPASQPDTRQPERTNQGTNMTPEPMRGHTAGRSNSAHLTQKPIFIGRKGSIVGNLAESKDSSGKWHVKDSNKSGPKSNIKLTGGKPKNSKIPLTGRSYKTTDLFVQDITRNEDDSLIDIANRVRAHCKDHDIRVTFARVYPKRFCTETVNCRISVPLDDVDSALGIRIWPDGVVCRRWNKEPPNKSYSEKSNYKGNSNSQYRNNNNNWGSRANRQHDKYDQYDHDDDYQSDYPPEHWEERYGSNDRYGGRYGR